MTAVRFTHRQADWRRLNLDQSVRPRRCHDRGIYGRLQPMHKPDHTGLYCKAIAFVAVAYFVGRLFT